MWGPGRVRPRRPGRSASGPGRGRPCGVESVGRGSGTCSGSPGVPGPAVESSGLPPVPPRSVSRTGPSGTTVGLSGLLSPPEPPGRPVSAGDGRSVTRTAPGCRRVVSCCRESGRPGPTSRISLAVTIPRVASVPALSRARTAVATPVVLPVSRTAGIPARLMTVPVRCLAIVRSRMVARHPRTAGDEGTTICDRSDARQGRCSELARLSVTRTRRIATVSTKVGCRS